MKRRIIQIAVAGIIENAQTQSEAIILALCDDGTLWATTNRGHGWQQWDQPKDGEELGQEERIRKLEEFVKATFD